MASFNTTSGEYESTLNGDESRIEVSKVIIGKGSYGEVRKATFRGLDCVGKRLHTVLLQSRSDVNLKDRFMKECEILERLHHPNIVQFLGLCNEKDHELPILLMEYLPISLSKCIDGLSNGLAKCIDGRILPDALAYSILRDVALGLCYLHHYRPDPIIHRDLTANNVLLTSDMTAKIADLGVARILNLSYQGKMTMAPGTPAYMPPEALKHNPVYTENIDIFSYGVLILYILSGSFPDPDCPTDVDPNNPNKILSRTEVERREKYFENVGCEHPLKGLIRNCLHNHPPFRPKAYDVLDEVKKVVSSNPVNIENKIRAFQIVAEVTSKRDKEEEDIAESVVVIEAMSSVHRHIVDKPSPAESVVKIDPTSSAPHTHMLDKPSPAVVKIDPTSSAPHTHMLDKPSLAVVKTDPTSSAPHTHMLDKPSLAVVKTDPTSSAPHTRMLDKPSLAPESKLTESAVEINRMFSSLHQNPHSSSKISTPGSHPCQPATKFACNEKCDDLLFPLYDASAVVFENAVYVGGGITSVPDKYNCIFRYSLENKTWETTVPSCGVKRFGLTTFDNRLVVVGGITTDSTKENVSREVFYIDKNMEQWKYDRHLYPQMPTPRHSLTVMEFESNLIACGGVGGKGVLDTVEVFKLHSRTWYTTHPLPSPCYAMSFTVIQGTCYMLGGRNREYSYTSRVFYARLSSLCEAVLPANPKITHWDILKDIPDNNAVAANLNDCLVAIGGVPAPDLASFSLRPKPRISIYLQQAKSSWYTLAQLPNPYACIKPAVAELPDGELLIIGGATSTQFVPQKTVYKGRVMNI